MANYHGNSLAIAASEEDMCKVLRRMAENLAANSEYTRFDIDSVEGLSSVRDLYFQVGSVINSSYIFAFAGAPIRSDIAAKYTPGWDSPTSSEGGFMMQVAALSAALSSVNTNQLGGTSVSLSMTAPTGRAMDNTANSVTLTRYGENWVLYLWYYTAWKPNDSDLDTFFMGLPEGEYGVAFYDADEYDGYESISEYQGLHHGLAPLHDGAVSQGLISSADFLDLKRKCLGTSKEEITDLTELANAVNACGWDEWDVDYDDGLISFRTISPFCDSEGGSLNIWDRPPVNWKKPSVDDTKTVFRALAEIAAGLPIKVRVVDFSRAEGKDAIESLLPGDLVRLSSEWGDIDLVGLDVETVSGIRIGKLSSWLCIPNQDYETSRAASGVLALILPHIKATVGSLTPLSLRNTGVENPDMEVFLEMLETDLSVLPDEVLALLEKPCAERTLSSYVGEAM